MVTIWFRATNKTRRLSRILSFSKCNRCWVASRCDVQGFPNISRCTIGWYANILDAINLRPSIGNVLRPVRNRNQLQLLRDIPVSLFNINFSTNRYISTIVITFEFVRLNQIFSLSHVRNCRRAGPTNITTMPRAPTDKDLASLSVPQLLKTPMTYSFDLSSTIDFIISLYSLTTISSDGTAVHPSSGWAQLTGLDSVPRLTPLTRPLPRAPLLPLVAPRTRVTVLCDAHWESIAVPSPAACGWSGDAFSVSSAEMLH